MSNGLIINEFWEKVFSKYNIAFSLDSVREKNCNSTLKYLDSKNICFSIISLDIDHPNYEFLQQLKNLKSISIKPYSKTTNSAKYKSKMLEIAKRLYNDYPLLLSKLELPEPTRDDVEHYFLFPDGKLYDVTYNNGNEIFQSIQSDRSVVDIGCLSCEFYHRCFNEHYYGY